jgi:hypothetical protein
LQQQAPRSQYQPQYFQSGTGSAVNSIPPSRDPKQQQTVVGGGPQAPPSQVGTPTMAIQPHMTSVPGSAAGGAAAQPLPATSVPQPSVAGSVGTAVTASGGVALPPRGSLNSKSKSLGAEPRLSSSLPGLFPLLNPIQNRRIKIAFLSVAMNWLKDLKIFPNNRAHRMLLRIPKGRINLFRVFTFLNCVKNYSSFFTLLFKRVSVWDFPCPDFSLSGLMRNSYQIVLDIL